MGGNEVNMEGLHAGPGEMGVVIVPPDKFRPHLSLSYFFSGSQPIMVTMQNAYIDGLINQSMFGEGIRALHI
jgi:hypothetical protein